jgi:hypothetical protein
MLYLKDVFHDFALLPLPPVSRLNYQSLASVAAAFHKNATPYISLPEFEDVATKHLNFSAQNSRVYYELFAVLFGHDECLYLNNNARDGLDQRFPATKIQNHCLIPPTQFILFLFNQLYNSPSRGKLIVDEDALSLDKNSPRELMDGRNALALFWKDNASKWLNLVHIANYGRRADIDLSQTGTHISL